MPYSQVDLANAALGMLMRDVSLRDLDGGDPASVHVKQNLQMAIEEVIEEYDWPQCRVIENLATPASINLRDWAVAYAIPSDAVAIWRVSNLRGETVEQFELGMSEDITSTTNYIFADTEGLAIRYGSRRAPVERFTPLVRNLMAIKLAIKCAMPLTKDAKLRKFYEDTFKVECSHAKTLMANLEPEVYDTEFIPETISVRSQ